MLQLLTNKIYIHYRVQISIQIMELKRSPNFFLKLCLSSLDLTRNWL